MKSDGLWGIKGKEIFILLGGKRVEERETVLSLWVRNWVKRERNCFILLGEKLGEERETVLSFWVGNRVKREKLFYPSGWETG